MTVDKGTWLRAGAAVALALGALTLFILHRYVPGSKPEQLSRQSPSEARHRGPADWRENLSAIDVEIDSALSQAGIRTWWIRKKSIPVTDANFSRVERKIEVPRELQTVELNSTLNELAHRFEGRAIASENLKERLVTIHVDISGYVVQTIVLHSTDNLPPPPAEKKRSQQKRA